MKRPIPSQTVGWGFLLSAIVVLAFANCILNGFVWDDEQFVQENAYLSSPQMLPKLLTRNIVEGAGITSNLYRPMQGLTHFIDVRLWGLWAGGHHLTNVFFHLAVSLALLFVFSRLFPPLPAFLAAALFALHPLQSETVAYVSGRGDSMAMLFMALGLLTFRRSLGTSLLFMALGVLSKESMVMFPVFLFLFEYAQGNKIELKCHAPFWMLSAVYTALRLTVLNFQNTLNFYGEAHNVFTDNFLYRVLTYLTTAAKGWMLWLMPLDLHHERSWPVYVSLFTPRAAASLCILLSLGMIALWARKSQRVLAAGIVWFFAATFPTSNLVVLINAIFYDHWFLLPGIGIALVFGWLITEAQKQQRLYKAVTAFSLLLIAALAWMTVKNNAVWRSNESLYRHILRFEPDSAKIHANLGMALADKGEQDEAIRQYQDAIKISDEYPQTHHNLAMAYLRKDRVEEAVQEFKKALAMDPRFHHSWENLGVIYLRSGRREQAEEAFRNVIGAFRYSPLGYLGLAEALRLKGDMDGAVLVLREGVEAMPQESDLRMALEAMVK